MSTDQPGRSDASEEVEALAEGAAVSFHVVDVVGIAEAARKRAIAADPSHEHEIEWHVECKVCGVAGRLLQKEKHDE